ncbi:hypothetical protein CAAN1_09S05512 [[Candida] anglica]|uniref:DUF7082 domain-containing protein n=1 Tax=[Candida] anglica TaxID=148631 RepID=A0ABP0EFA0_9ASCO
MYFSNPVSYNKFFEMLEYPEKADPQDLDTKAPSYPSKLEYHSSSHPHDLYSQYAGAAAAATSTVGVGVGGIGGINGGVSGATSHNGGIIPAYSFHPSNPGMVASASHGGSETTSYNNSPQIHYNPNPNTSGISVAAANNFNYPSSGKDLFYLQSFNNSAMFNTTAAAAAASGTVPGPGSGSDPTYTNNNLAVLSGNGSQYPMVSQHIPLALPTLMGPGSVAAAAAAAAATAAATAVSTGTGSSAGVSSSTGTPLVGGISSDYSDYSHPSTLDYYSKPSPRLQPSEYDPRTQLNSMNAPLTKIKLEHHQYQQQEVSQQQQQQQQDQPRYSSQYQLSTGGGGRRFRVIRGMSAGGSTSKPPKVSPNCTSDFQPVELEIIDGTVEDICFPKWNYEEKSDRRRIVRIERTQEGSKLVAKFSIVGSAAEHPVPVPATNPNVDVIEVSCLECSIRNDYYGDEETQDSDDGGGHSPKSMANGGGGGSRSSFQDELGYRHQYYITSVEVVGIVELLIGTQLKDPAERRKERGRVRSNLVPFWSKKPISSRETEESLQGSDFRWELAKRIMGYEMRKPRGFDKEVRILRWDKLIPALKRALQSYYTEIPRDGPAPAPHYYG